MLEIQRLACEAVQVTLGGRNLSQVLAETWGSNPNLSPSQRAAIQDLSYGSIRFYGVLEAVLKLLLRKPVTDELLRVLLIVGLYQLQYTRAKPFAIVDHAVSTSRVLGRPAAKGLVNAVLRNFLRSRETLLAEVLEKQETAVYNHPIWWITKIKTEYPDHWQQVLQVGNKPPPMTLRVNRRQYSVEAYLALLRDQGIEARCLEEEALVLSHPLPVDKLPGFAEGAVSVQDASAQKAAELLDLAPGMRVLDACSAPGGKTGHLLEIADIQMTALDSDPERLKRVADNLRRLKLSANLKVADAAALDTWWDGVLFDRILIDAPCTGSGVVRRHPDIKWNRRYADTGQFASQQARLLRTLWPILKVGGRLLYVTCSVFREENYDQIAAHLSRCPDANCLPLTGVATINGQIVPDDFHDGFFYAVLAKK